MERAKVFIFAGVGAITALVIYGAAATKKATGTDGRQNRLARIEALMNEGGAAYRPSFFRRHNEHKHVQVAGLEPVKTVTEVAPPAAPVKDAKAEEAKKAAEKKAADEKKKKEDAKKKKKKKKKEDATQPAAPADTSANPKDDEKKKDESVDGGAGTSGAVSAYGANPNAAADPNKIPVTVDEWIAYLFTNPSVEKTSKFIQLAQINVVKADVFYPVVEKMLTGEGRLPEFGVMAIGSVPSAQSFELLADVANEPTMPEKLKIVSQQYMNAYTRPENVAFLGTVVTTSKDTLAANDAILWIQLSFKNLQELATSNQPTTSTARTPASKKIYDVYTQLASVLTAAGTSSVDGSTRTNATQAAAELTSRLQAVSAQFVASSNVSPTH